MISFVVNSIPIAQPRQRTRVIPGTTFAHNYTPTKSPVNAFKAAVQLAASQAYEGAPLDGPLSLGLTFILPRPKSMIKKRGENPRAWHAKKPDFDNLAKSVCDACGGLLWRDDSQLARVLVKKIIASADEQPRVAIFLTYMDGIEP